MREHQTTLGFEAWVHHDLTQRFDSTLYEPIPEELLALLRVY